MFEKGDADVALLPGSAIRAYQLESRLVIPIPPSHLYPPVRAGAGVLRGTKHPRRALEFVRFAISPDQAIFRQAGFDEPAQR